jgi:hypothetical protein
VTAASTTTIVVTVAPRTPETADVTVTMTMTVMAGTIIVTTTDLVGVATTTKKKIVITIESSRRVVAGSRQIGSVEHCTDGRTRTTREIRGS